MRFTFQAKDQSGAMREGIVDAPNQSAAVEILQRNNLIPLNVKREDEVSGIMKEFKKIWEGVSQKELMVFFRQLATLVEAKVPLVTSLNAIHEQVENDYMKILLKGMAADIEDGATFSESISKYPNVFTPLMVNMIKAGEVSGNLQKSIEFLADNIEKNYELTAKIKGALFYPVFVVTAASIIGFVVITFILPKLTQVIKDMGVEVPWYTVAIMALGDFMSQYWWAVLLIIMAGIGGLAYYLHTESGKREWEIIQLRLPVFGLLFRYLYLSRFADNFSTMITAGIPMVRALTITGDVLGSHVYRDILMDAVEQVKSGGSVSSVFARSSEIPPLVTQMVKIGEETGKIGDVLQSTSRFYTSEIENMARNMTALIEPILIVALGLGVAVMVFAILMPIYNIAGQIK